MLTVDEALGVLQEAKKYIGGDKCLILSLTDSGLEDATIDKMVVLTDHTQGGSQYVEVRVRHPCLSESGPFCSTKTPAQLVNEALQGIDEYKRNHDIQGRDPDLEYTVETLLELAGRLEGKPSNATENES